MSCEGNHLTLKHLESLTFISVVPPVPSSVYIDYLWLN